MTKLEKLEKVLKAQMKDFDRRYTKAADKNDLVTSEYYAAVSSQIQHVIWMIEDECELDEAARILNISIDDDD